MSVHTHPKERQREPLIVVGFKIVEITLKTAIEACYIVTAIGKDFSYFLAPPSLSTIDYDSSICGHGFEHMGQRVEWRIDGTFDRVGGEVGWFPQVEQRDRIRSAADDLKAHIRGLGDEGQVVMGLVSLEMQLEEMQ